MKENKKIWLSSPHMGGEEMMCVKEAFDTNWIAPVGPHISDFEKKLAANAKKNPKAFYRYINSTCKTQSKVGPLKDAVGNVQTDDATQTEILNDTFVKSFTCEDLSSLPTPEPKFDPSLGTPLSNICWK